MPTASLTGKDTIIIGGRTLVDFGDGDIFTLTFPNELVGVKTGKSGNSIYALNETGKEADAEIRVLRGSSDDKFLNSNLLDMLRDFASYTLLTGELNKRVGDGLGNVTNEIYTLSGGVVLQNVDVKSNVEGDTEQSISLYRLKFTNAPKSIA